MNSQSPEDRLLDELLREQAKGPDEAFLQQIEAAVDAPVKLPVHRRRYLNLAVAAAVAITVGGLAWSVLEKRESQIAANLERDQLAKKTAAATAARYLEQAIRDQEDKLEERRKVLASIERTKGIVYRGQGSEYSQTGVDEQIAKNDTRENAINRGLDAQDYGDAKREFEDDQNLLLAMQMKLTELRTSGGGQPAGAESSMSERAEIVAGGMKKEQIAHLPAKSRLVAAEGAQSNHSLPESTPLADLPSDDRSSLASGGMSVGMGRGGAGMGSGSGLGRGASPKPGVLFGQSPPASMDAAEAPVKLSKARAAGFILPGEAMPESNSGDRYGTFIDQPWKSPDREPLSTFSIDVDTASYSNVRRMIQEGREIPRDAVRIEECINAFSYHYQQPKGDAPFAVGAMLAVCPWAPEHQLVRVAIKGREIETNKRPASNLVFLIDVSGSMQSPDKLPLLKQSMATLVEQLDERDRVAIVVYAGSEGVALPSTRLDAAGRATVLKSLSKLEAGGSTNGGAGIKRAYELAMKQKIQGGVNRVLLATDGDFNVGVTGQQSLVELVKNRAQGGVYLTVLGFGTGNLNDAMMDAITHDGNGNYFYIDSEREGRKVFLKNLTGTLVTIAKDVKIQVEFNPAKVGGYRLIGYSNRVLRNEDFANDKVDAGDIGAGHTVTAFYELAPPGTASGTDDLKYQAAPPKPAATTDEWLTVKLRHKHPDGDESRLIEFPLTGDALALDKTGVDFQFATAAALFGMKLRGMDEVKDIGWDKVLELAEPGLADDAMEERAEFVGLVKKLSQTNERIVPAPAEVVPSDRFDQHRGVPQPRIVPPPRKAPAPAEVVPADRER